jgi:hypothetical protein
MFQNISAEHFETVLKSGALKKDNHERCIRIFYDATKIIYYRQERLNKSQLRMNQIASALLLVGFYHSSLFRFQVSGGLAANFRDCPEEKALEYFDKHVAGKVADVSGRIIEIEDTGAASLYKDRYTGKHQVAAENYESIRGKRLPWIRHVLSGTRAIFQADEYIQGKFQRSYLYSSLASIPTQDGMKHSYFIVVVRERGNQVLRFVTAYPISSHNRFLKRMEECTPFAP